MRAAIGRQIEVVLDHGQYIIGPEVNEVEERLAEYVDVNYAIASSNCTDELLIALVGLDIKTGDESIMTLSGSPLQAKRLHC